MEKVNLNIRIIDNNKVEQRTKVIGEYNKKNNMFSYRENDVLVNIIIDNKIVIRRKHNDYELELILEENKVHNSLYIIKNPKMNIRIEVETMLLRRCENNFYVEYMLKMDNENIGKFIVDFKMEE